MDIRLKQLKAEDALKRRRNKWSPITPTMGCYKRRRLDVDLVDDVWSGLVHRSWAADRCGSRGGRDAPCQRNGKPHQICDSVAEVGGSIDKVGDFATSKELK